MSASGATRYFTKGDGADSSAVPLPKSVNSSKPKPQRKQPPKKLDNFNVKPLDVSAIPGNDVDAIHGVKTKFHKSMSLQAKSTWKQTSDLCQRTQILNGEIGGSVSRSDAVLCQKDVLAQADTSTATKSFCLELEKFGPYRCCYSRNARHLLIGGKMGHIASFDWMTKRLSCEFNCMEQINDVQWLHNELMFAVAQRKWTFIYDNQGVELHCLKHLHKVRNLTFLPFHYLLVGGSETSYLHWLDVSVGKMVASFPTREGPLNVMCQNPANAIICLGHSRGTVTMWSPNSKEPLVKCRDPPGQVKTLCHPSPVRSVSVDSKGMFMATAGMDSSLKIWDLRTYKAIQNYKILNGLNQVVWSQRGLLAASVGSTVHVFDNVTSNGTAILRNDSLGTVVDLEFCPFEDVLGVGHRKGFDSIIVPGAGEPNIDAFEANPFQTKKQRQEMEVRSLLDKIQPELITLDSREIGRVDEAAFEEKLAERSRINFLKPSEIQMKKKKKKLKGSTKAKLKEKQREEAIRSELIAQQMKKHNQLLNEASDDDKPPALSTDVLDRFVKKKNSK